MSTIVKVDGLDEKGYGGGRGAYILTDTPSSLHLLRAARSLVRLSERSLQISRVALYSLYDSPLYRQSRARSMRRGRVMRRMAHFSCLRAKRRRRRHLRCWRVRRGESAAWNLKLAWARGRERRITRRVRVRYLAIVQWGGYRGGLTRGVGGWGRGCGVGE